MADATQVVRQDPAAKPEGVNSPAPALAVDGGWPGEADEAVDADFKPLTPAEAQAWRSRQPADSVWRLVGWQVVLVLLVAAVAGVWSRNATVVWSSVYGGCAVLVPTALMAYGLTSSGLAKWLALVWPGWSRAALAGLLFWEGVKVLLVLALLWLAPRFVPGLSWLALVAGLVVVLKAYWLELYMRSRSRSRTVF
jgi:ATP synthase protein I